MKITLILISVISTLFSFIFNSDGTVEQELEKRIKVKNFIVKSKKLHTTKSIEKVYMDNAFKPFWTNNNVQELTELISKCRNEGLNPLDYNLNEINEFLSKNELNNNEKTDLELLCTDAFLLYASHLMHGKVNPETIDSEWKVIKNEGNPIELLYNAITRNDIKNTLKGVLPKHDKYVQLKKVLAEYRTIQSKGGWDTVSDGITLKLNDDNPRVKELRKRLVVTKDITTKNLSSSFFDEEVKLGVEKFQKRSGLDIDGKVGSNTLKYLNVSIEDRINQIVVNMERWRWLPRQFSSYYVKVNIADFNLTVVKNQKIERMHNVIVGKYARRTPVMTSRMNYLVLNPTWTVPPTILKEDIIPSVRKNTNYLKTKNLQVINSSGTVLNPSTINWQSNAVFGYTYRQPAGSDNALGLVKFIFPNKYNIYIHDTPSRELFGLTERTFSSGCVRVQNPLELAQYLINDEVKWSRQKIDNVIKSKVTTNVTLKEKPDIYILYWTVWLDGDDFHFRKDVYDRDARVLSALKEKF